jgi:hypothetical protein
MPCTHRFVNYHCNGLFPDWEIKFLFIGTFNPHWNKSRNNADYFYGRSKYFWVILPRFFEEESLMNSNAEQKISFSKKHGIGFTDLILKIDNANLNNPTHKEKILSFKDRDLLYFRENLIFNTPNINCFIDEHKSLERVYFTLLGNNAGLISTAISTIEQHCLTKKTQTPTHRLHTHTGQGLGEGKPRSNTLTHRWYTQGANFLNENFDPNDFPIH